MGILSKEDTENLKKKVKVKGYKLTPQRRAILDVIIENEGKHLSSEEIFEAVKKIVLKSGLQQFTELCKCLKK